MGESDAEARCQASPAKPHPLLGSRRLRHPYPAPRSPWPLPVQPEPAVAVRLDEIRAAGQPATPQELLEAYALPPGTPNVADAYLRAFERIAKPTEAQAQVIPQTSSDANASLPPDSEPLPPVMLQTMRRWLASNTEALEKLREAADAVGESRYPTIQFDDFDTLVDALIVPALSHVHWGSRLLSVAAHAAAEEDRPADATGAVVDMLALARSVQVPATHAALVRATVTGRAADATERLLNRLALSRAQLQQIQSAFARTESSSLLHEGLIGDRAANYGAFDVPYWEMSGGAATLRLRWIMFKRWFLGYDYSDRLRYLDITTDYVDAAALPTHQRLSAMDAAAAKKYAVPHTYQYMMTHVLTPIGEVAVVSFLRMLAKVRLATTAVAVERYRLDHGHLPNALGDLVPAFLVQIPLDPLTANLCAI